MNSIIEVTEKDIECETGWRVDWQLATKTALLPPSPVAQTGKPGRPAALKATYAGTFSGDVPMTLVGTEHSPVGLRVK